MIEYEITEKNYDKNGFLTFGNLLWHSKTITIKSIYEFLYDTLDLIKDNEISFPMINFKIDETKFKIEIKQGKKVEYVCGKSVRPAGRYNQY